MISLTWRRIHNTTGLLKMPTTDAKKIKHTGSNLQRAVAIAVLTVLSQSVAQSQEAEQFRPLSQFFDDDNGSVQTGTTPDGRTRYEVRGGYAIAQGDMVIGKVAPSGLTELLNRGVGRTGGLDLWTDGIVYYQKSDSLPANDVAKIDEAVAHWNQYSSLNLIERTGELIETQPDYIQFEPSGGCASWVGRIGGEQSIWVGETCTTGSVIHEIGHAIGLFHEHTRTDRDNFINVLWDNIVEGKEFNFDILDAGAEDLGEYDYESVMHYGATFFSRNGEPTILSPDGIQVGQRIALSQTDLESVNTIYGTDLLPTSSVDDSGATTRVNIVVDNISENGANTITVSLPVENASSAAGGFAGTGWNCTALSNEVSCSLDRLGDGEQSQLVLDLANGSINSANTGLWLESRSFDTDLSNNGEIPDDYTQAGTFSDFDAEAFHNGDNTGGNTTGSTPPATDDNTASDVGDQDSAPAEESDAADTGESTTAVPVDNTVVNVPENTDDTDAGVDNNPPVGQALPGFDTDADIDNSSIAASSSSGGGGAAGLLLPLLTLFALPTVFRRRGKTVA